MEYVRTVLKKLHWTQAVVAHPGEQCVHCGGNALSQPGARCNVRQSTVVHPLSVVLLDCPVEVVVRGCRRDRRSTSDTLVM